MVIKNVASMLFTPRCPHFAGQAPSLWHHSEHKKFEQPQRSGADIDSVNVWFYYHYSSKKLNWYGGIQMKTLQQESRTASFLHYGGYVWSFLIAAWLLLDTAFHWADKYGEVTAILVVGYAVLIMFVLIISIFTLAFWHKVVSTVVHTVYCLSSHDASASWWQRTEVGQHQQCERAAPFLFND